jgi:hypothetical protein
VAHAISRSYLEKSADGSGTVRALTGCVLERLRDVVAVTEVGRGVIAVAAAVAVLGSAGAAHAELHWDAPDSCPSASSVEARIEQRLGRSLDPDVAATTSITVRLEHGQLTARLELASEARALTAGTCDELADAIAIIVSRLAEEHALVHVAPMRILAAQDFIAPVVVHRELAATAAHPWTLGVRLSGVSGIGIVPEVGLGAEVAISGRYNAWMGELAATKWLASGADGHAASHVDVGLGVTSARIGWRPEHHPLRAWLGAEVGSMDGTGTNLASSQPNSGRWFAAGGGFGIGWPLTPWLRAVGSTEVLLAIERVKFAESNGTVLYAPSPISARATFGIEIGWQ